MSHILVEQANKELGRLLDDLDTLRERFAQVNPEAWMEDDNRHPKQVYDAIERSRTCLQTPFFVLGDWESIMPKTEGVPDGAPESL